MVRKRKRKKRENPEEESLQVDLLDDSPAPRSADEPTGHERSGTGQPSREPADRWAKAVGQLKPSRPEEERDAPLRGDDLDTHASARDHAAAVRPAGEPLARARELVERGRIHEAIQLYLGILTVNPSNLKAHNNLGVLLDEMRQFEAAREHFEAAARIAPDNVEVLTNYAATLTSLARYDEAEELLRKAQRLSAEDVQAHLGIGILYFRRGLYAQAEAELGWVCSRDESSGSAFYYRGEALNRLGRYDEAITAVRRAIDLMPDDPRPYYTLGHLYDRRHDLEEAAEMYRTAQRLQGP